MNIFADANLCKPLKPRILCPKNPGGGRVPQQELDEASTKKLGLFCRVMSAIETHEVAEPSIRRRAMRHLEKGRIVIFAAGTGNPFFSTDTAASLRAMEIKADILLKATSVDGIYTADPKVDEKATKFDQITYSDILRLNLRVMDTTAVSLCKDNNMPMMVFSMREPGNIVRVVSGERIGSLVTA